MLELQSISTSYGSVPINRDVTFEVGRGDVVALIGRNGVGKTTLAKAVIGLIRPTAGVVVYDGKDVTKQPAQTRARAGIGYVPQGRGIFSDLTVEENLRMGLRIGGGRGSLAEIRELFPILRERAGQLGGTLSGGQQQLLAIGRVLVGRPRLLLLDEPSDGIQPNLIEEIGVLISRLNSEKSLTTLLIEQNVDLILACASRCLVMEKGVIVDEIDPASLEDPEIAGKYLAI